MKMYKLLIFIYTCFIFCLPLQAENELEHQEMRQVILHDYFLKDIRIALDQYKDFFRTSLTDEQFMEKFNEIISSPEMQASFLEIIAQKIPSQDLAPSIRLLQDENYQKYHQALERASAECHIKLILEKIPEMVEQYPYQEKPDAKEFIHLNKNNFQQIMQSSRPVIIDVYTEWCPPCKKLSLLLSDLNEQMGDRYLFVKYNPEIKKILQIIFRFQLFPRLFSV